jgi:hypothetical protein
MSCASPFRALQPSKADHGITYGDPISLRIFSQYSTE